MSKQRILLIEDEEDIAKLVSLHLTGLCDDFAIARDGHEGMKLALEQDWSLIILDWQLPGPDGLEICRAVRQKANYQPIMMLTANTSEPERILGLETGADDYVSKPFSILELVARVRAIFRRTSHEEDNKSNKLPSAAHINIGELFIDPDQRRIDVAGHSIDLTAREFTLLEFFARHPGRVFPREQLLDQVWGYGHEGYEHTVNSHINRLRAKIEKDPANPKMIVTVWGVGYKFVEQKVPA